MSCFSSISLNHQLEISILSLRLHHQSKASTLLINGVYFIPAHLDLSRRETKNCRLAICVGRKTSDEEDPKSYSRCGPWIIGDARLYW